MKKILIAASILSSLFACKGGDNTEYSTEIISNPNSASVDSTDKDKMPFFDFVEEVIDFGTITQGEVVSTAFKFKNAGKTDLIISSAQGSCGCTVPEWPMEPIKPGSEGIIKVTFNSSGKQGLQNKTITLVANTIPNTKVIALKGNILVPENTTKK
ncbi:MAG: DUF1573 domain-containing protein [Flavobacteriales bacterium]|nr:DUF1573 domain-containing protein [Flavobacteriales bacterium]